MTYHPHLSSAARRLAVVLLLASGVAQALERDDLYDKGKIALARGELVTALINLSAYREINLNNLELHPDFKRSINFKIAEISRKLNSALNCTPCESSGGQGGTIVVPSGIQGWGYGGRPNEGGYTGPAIGNFIGNGMGRPGYRIPRQDAYQIPLQPQFAPRMQ